jgi:hypothetical protein
MSAGALTASAGDPVVGFVLGLLIVAVAAVATLVGKRRKSQIE